MATVISEDDDLHAKLDAAAKHVQKAYGAARDAATEAADKAKEGASHINDQALGLIRQRPYVSVIAMFTLGLFFGAIASR